MIKAGFSRVDVTPPLGSYMPGYHRDRYAKGMITPLYLNAVAISDGKETAVIITADFLGIKEAHATPIRKKIAEASGISPNNIIISALHQHTSIGLNNDVRLKNNVVHDKTYLDILYRKFSDVAKMAIDDMSDARLELAENQALEQISFVRRFVMKDGTVKGSASKDPNMLRPAGNPDNTVRLLRFVREDKNDIALVNFSTHPDTVGGELFCYDWPGYTRKYVEADHEGTFCILVNGAQGDTNHVNYTRESVGRGGPHARYMGRVIADTVKEIWDKTEPCENIKISAGVDFVYHTTRMDGAEYYYECTEKLKKVYAGTSTPGELDHVGGVGGACRIVRMRNDPLFQKLPVSVISLGKICFVGFGGEPFTHYVTAVREACPEKFVVALCCANGYEGYLPTKQAFFEGGYGVVNSPFQLTLEEDCVSTAVKMIKNF